MTDIAASLKTETVHTVTVTATPGEHFEVDDRTDRVAATRIEFKVYTDGDGVLRRLGTQWIATGFAFKADGTVGRQKRQVIGANPARLPQAVCEAVLSLLDASVHLIDHDEQLPGWEGGPIPPLQRKQRPAPDAQD